MNTTKTTPRDFFLHLGATIALYVSAIALLNLAFTTINYALPDKLANYFSPSSLVWPISILVVLTPILYVIEWFIARDLSRMNEKREIWIRRWRIYLTLFLTGATIAGDLVVLINTFLNGEITSRFIWKILTVLLVCALVFAYYIVEKMSDTGRGRGAKKSLAWLGIVFVLAGIVAGFLIVGSPAKQRAIRFDLQRTGDLSNIQYQVINYWQRTNRLPKDLSDLTDSISGYKVPNDPDNSKAYQYSVTGLQSFQLCATFSLSSADTQNAYKGGYVSYPDYGGTGSSNWDHPAGRACFDRTIDPTKFPPTNVKNLQVPPASPSR